MSTELIGREGLPWGPDVGTVRLFEQLERGRLVQKQPKAGFCYPCKVADKTYREEGRVTKLNFKARFMKGVYPE